MDCLGSDDVVRDVRIEAVFSVGPCFASCYVRQAKHSPRPPNRTLQLRLCFLRGPFRAYKGSRGDCSG
jgi:hypothetical protein